jgi:hypothetical protein
MTEPEDPERLADASSPLGGLFAFAARDLPSDEQLAHLAGKLGPVLDAAPAAAPVASGTSLLVKLGIATGAMALLVGGGLSLRRALTATTVAVPATPSVAVPTGDTTPPHPPAIPPPAAADRSASAPDLAPPSTLDKPGTTSAKPSAGQGKALSEAALLEQARRVLNSSPSSALLLANQHRARFPNGVLTQEREVIAIEALRRLHRNGEADQRAAGFSKAFPGSAHQRMVDEVVPK